MLWPAVSDREQSGLWGLWAFYGGPSPQVIPVTTIIYISGALPEPGPGLYTIHVLAPWLLRAML